MANQPPNRDSSSSEDAHLTSPTSATLPPLAPPRPFFIARSNGDRGSYSSSADSGTEAASDSDRDTTTPAAAPQPRARNHRRRSVNVYAAVDAAGADTPPPGTPLRDPFAGSAESQWAPPALYAESANGITEEPRGVVAPQPRNARAPPSSYAFPFQAYPGNPDPGTHIPGVASRRSSYESLRRPASAEGYAQPGGYGALGQASPALDGQYARPYAPFMVPGGGNSAPGTPGTPGTPDMPTPDLAAAPDFGNSRRSSAYSLVPPILGGGAVFRNSAAVGLASPTAGYPSSQGHGYASSQGHGYASSQGHGELPRVGSVGTFRAPFLSPASRPTSSMWTPPSYPAPLGSASGSVLNFAGGLKHRPPMPSARLAAKLTQEEKPWLNEKDSAGRVSWWLTFGMLVLGIAIGGVLCWRGYVEVPVLPDSELCIEYASNFAGGETIENSDTWSRVVGLGGFGNGEFEIMTPDSDNSYVANGRLYIKPTLTDQTGLTSDQVRDGYTYDLGDACTDSGNKSTCSVTSANGTTIIPPVKSARLTTQGKKSIAYGRVEVKAKIPRGDWLWPAIWMLPENADGSDLPYYGRWPMSGEIDILEARGNDMTYPAQGNNVARASLNYGVLPATQARIFGWQEFKRRSLADGFHTYALEWTPEFMRFYVDTRLQAMLTMHPGKQSFFDRGNFPKTARNGSEAELPITNIWQDGGNSAPFNQKFHLIISLAAGGTSGWFPDGYGGKPWYDTSGSRAMIDFYNNQSTWAATWPDNDDRAFIIESVKMYKFCRQP